MGSQHVVSWHPVVREITTPGGGNFGVAPVLPVTQSMPASVTKSVAPHSGLDAWGGCLFEHTFPRTALSPHPFCHRLPARRNTNKPDCPVKRRQTLQLQSHGCPAAAARAQNDPREVGMQEEQRQRAAATAAWAASRDARPPQLDSVTGPPPPGGSEQASGDQHQQRRRVGRER